MGVPHPVLEGVPHPVLDGGSRLDGGTPSGLGQEVSQDGGTPTISRIGCPPVLTWREVPHPGLDRGTPSSSWMGGAPHQLDGDGVPPIQTWDRVHSVQTWDGVPPPTSVDRMKILPSLILLMWVVKSCLKNFHFHSFALITKWDGQSVHLCPIIAHVKMKRIAQSVMKVLRNKSCVMNTTAGYVIMFIQNDVMTCKDVI